MEQQQPKASTLLTELLKQYKPVVSIKDGAELLGIPSENAARVAFRRGRLPVRLRICSGRMVFFLSDICLFLETGIPQEQIIAPKPAKIYNGRRRGRPTKAETIARRQAAAGGRTWN